MAWRRTLLSAAVVSLASLRLLPNAIGGAGIVLPAIALLGLAALWVAASRRANRIDKAVAQGRALPGSLALFSLAATAFAAGIAGLILVVIAR